MYVYIQWTSTDSVNNKICIVRLVLHLYSIVFITIIVLLLLVVQWVSLIFSLLQFASLNIAMPYFFASLH